MNPELAFEVAREAMLALGFETVDKGMPTFDVVESLTGGGSGVYNRTEHSVKVAARYFKGASGWSTLVHEMCHAQQPESVMDDGPCYYLQDGSMDYRLYCESLAECQARAVQAVLESGAEDVASVISLAGGVQAADVLWAGLRALKKAYGDQAMEVLNDIIQVTGASGKALKAWMMWAHDAKRDGLSKAGKPQHLAVSVRKGLNARMAVAYGVRK